MMGRRLQSILLRCLTALGVAGVMGAAGAVEPLPADWTYSTVQEPLPQQPWVDKVVYLEAGYIVPFADPERKTLKPWAQSLKDAGFEIFTHAPLEWTADLNAQGFRVMRYLRPTVKEGWIAEATDGHPEWLRIGEDGKPIAENDLCLVSPAADAIREMMASKVRDLGVIGFQFDGWYQGAYCKCAYCTETYLKETGRPIPPNDATTVDYRKYNVWRNKKMMERAVELRNSLREANPEAIICNWSNNDAYGAYPAVMAETLNAVFDLTTKEWWDYNDTYSIWMNKRMRGASGDRPVGLQSYNFMRGMKDVKSGVYHGSSNPRAEMLYRVHETMAFGSVPWVWPSSRGGFNDEDWEIVVKAYIDYLPYVHETRGLKYAACLDSFTTLQSSGIDNKEKDWNQLIPELCDKVADSRGGITRALMEAHIPFDVISEHNVTAETLAQYKVIYLPNTFCMAPRIAGLLREYVANGGGLVASYETSLYDEWGVKQSDFALADLFGASYVGSRETSGHRVGFKEGVTHPIVDDAKLHDVMGKNGYTTFWGRYARIKTAEGATAPMWGIDTEKLEDAALKDWTPVVLNTHGKGRVAYFPAAIDAAYFNASYPYQRMLLANATQWAAGERPSVRVDGPMCVIGGTFEKEVEGGKRQTIVHLLNDANTTLGHGNAADHETSFREEVLPIHDVKVTFDGAKPGRVFVVPGGAELTAEKAADGSAGWTVTVPKLELHSVVVAEYSK